MATPPTLEARLARVEQVIAALSREVAAIRTELGNAAPDGAQRARRPCGRQRAPRTNESVHTRHRRRCAAHGTSQSRVPREISARWTSSD